MEFRVQSNRSLDYTFLCRSRFDIVCGASISGIVPGYHVQFGKSYSPEAGISGIPTTNSTYMCDVEPYINRYGMKSEEN